MDISRTIKTDVLVVGGGGAAARAALSASLEGANVRMAVKGKFLKSGSTATAFSELLAIAAAIGHGDERDHPEIHYKDTMEAGRGFIDPNLVWVLASEAPDRIWDLVALGLDFDKQPNGKLVQGMSDFATYPRTCRVNGVTSRHILNALANRLKERNVPVDEYMMVFRLLSDGGKIAGALARDLNSGEWVLYETPAVVLACGGAHHLYKYGVGTPDMIGDGYAMAFELGVPLVNMEFVQIGPAEITPPFTLLSGPVWKTHPVLYGADGERFLEKSLPPDVPLEEVYNHKAFPFTISNASFYLDTSIQRQFEKFPTPNGGVWGEMRPGSEDVVEQKMPKTKRVLKGKGIDVHKDRMEIALIVQCMNGGAQILNADCETNVKGLFIAGETAGGLRGPDRPGGNSLCEGQVFGNRAGRAAAAYANRFGSFGTGLEMGTQAVKTWSQWVKEKGGGMLDLNEAVRSLQENMYQNCLVIRNESRLNAAEIFLNELSRKLETGQFSVSEKNVHRAIELKHMLTTARSIVLSARERKESRSCHYREDYPEKDDLHWKRSIRILNDQGNMKVEFYSWPEDRVGEGTK